ncbi:MAG: D-aminoacyl-tRNA deacylase [Bacilli bacterium]|nr:D-aminoacyl-tRNA deacylase [Bacilli bacterium]
MRVLLQTVNEAHVEISNKCVGKINKGYLLLVGFTDTDSEEIVTKMVDKILSLRVFADENRQINLSLYDVNGDILSISQFTLYADASKGRRPSFINAMRPHEAENLYDLFNKLLEQKYRPIATGVFGADMQVYSDNDGPFTLILDSEELFK